MSKTGPGISVYYDAYFHQEEGWVCAVMAKISDVDGSNSHQFVKLGETTRHHPTKEKAISQASQRARDASKRIFELSKKPESR